MNIFNQREAADIIASRARSGSGLFPIIGLPRSGKSTLLLNIYESVTAPKILIKSGEYDCFDVKSGMEKYASLRLRIINIVNILSSADLNAVIMVDSMKDVLYDAKSSMRIGGIANEAVSRLNELNILCKQHNIFLIGVISTSTVNMSYNQEIASIIAGSSTDLAICKYDYSVAMDEGETRSSIFEITTNLIATPDVIDSDNFRK